MRRIEGRFTDQVIIVTGAAGAVGSAIVRRAADEGGHIVAADKADDVTKTVKELVGPAAPAWMTVTGNLADRSVVDAMVDEALKRFGHVDVLVNNAGGGINRPFLSHDASTMRETVDRNLWPAVHCSQAVMPHLIERRRGRIVNVGADSVRNGLYEHAMYNAAKGGVHGLTTGLARELAPYSVTVNTVAPTAIQTPFTLNPPPEAKARLAKNLELIPMGRFGTTDEVASAVLYLASEEAGFITGQVISVNGGSTML